MPTATIFEAKTRLSELIRKAQAGETVIITSGRNKQPVVQLVPVAPVKKPQRLGFLEDSDFVLGDAFWEPLSEEEMGLAPDPIDDMIRESFAELKKRSDTK